MNSLEKSMDASVRKAYIEKLTGRVLASIKKNGGNDFLSSIILTGSFGRDEPTFAWDEREGWILKSDVEIALIFRRLLDRDRTEKLMKAVSSEFSEDLNLMAISEGRVRNACNFNYSIKTPRYKTMFTYDFFHGSRTIWGEDFLKRQTILLSDVDLYEAKRLTANRIGELVYWQNKTDGVVREELSRQWKAKLVLAIAGGWLLCEGKYVSSYHGQLEALTAIREKADKQLGTGFFEEYKKVFQFLRESKEAYEVPERKLRKFVHRINVYFKKRKFRAPKVNSISRRAKYWLKYMKTDMQYGVFGFEDHILQALLDRYENQDAAIGKTADIWHRVLY